jgi:hypothetical protein
MIYSVAGRTRLLIERAFALRWGLHTLMRVSPLGFFPDGLKCLYIFNFLR